MMDDPWQLYTHARTHARTHAHEHTQRKREKKRDRATARRVGHLFVCVNIHVCTKSYRVKGPGEDVHAINDSAHHVSWPVLGQPGSNFNLRNHRNHRRACVGMCRTKLRETQRHTAAMARAWPRARARPASAAKHPAATQLGDVTGGRRQA